MGLFYESNKLGSKGLGRPVLIAFIYHKLRFCNQPIVKKMYKNLLTFLLVCAIGLSLQAQDPTMTLPSIIVDESEEFEIEMSVSNFTDLITMQFTIQWDPTKMTLLEIPYFDLLDLDSSRFGIASANLDEGTEFMSVASPIPCDANDNDLLTWSNSMFGPILGPLVPTMYTNDSLIQPIPLCQSRHHSSSKLLSKSTPTSWQWQAAMRSAGDSAILCRAKAMLMVNATSSSKNNRWLYYFTHTPAVSLNMGNLKYYGAFHGAEVPFVFGFLKEVTTPEEVKLSRAMGCYWTNFAETGNPNTGDCVNELKLMEWPRLNENGNVLEFVGSENQTAVAVNGLKEKICTTFAKFY